jgi:hypothetical protein
VHHIYLDTCSATQRMKVESEPGSAWPGQLPAPAWSPRALVTTETKRNFPGLSHHTKCYGNPDVLNMPKPIDYRCDDA